MGSILTKRTRVEMITTKSTKAPLDLLRLGDDLLLQILILLSAKDIVAVRETCKYLSCVSSSRYLWHHLLRRDVVKQYAPIPSYRKPNLELSSQQLELLTRRALRLDSSPQEPTIVRFDQTRSITWIRLVHGQWMLVASSSPKESTLSLYSSTSFQDGKPELLASTQLPGPVSSGEVEVQEDQLVVALCFQSPERMVTVLSVRQCENSLSFLELSRFAGLSHIRCLRKDLIGCGVQGEINAPCVANWRTGEVVTFSAPEVDGRCLAMTLRDGICAVVIGETLYIHSLLADGRTELAQTIYLSHVVGNVVISGESESSPVSDAATAPERFQLFITNKTGIYVYSVRQQDSTTFSADLIVEEETKPGASQSARPSYPLFGGSTSRVSWIYAPTSFFDRQPHLVTAKIQRKDGEAKTCAAELSVVSECKDSKLPALYTLPVMHYDDGAGLMAIGNACGQLALCSFGGSMPSGLAGCFRDVPVPRMV